MIVITTKNGFDFALKRWNWNIAEAWFGSDLEGQYTEIINSLNYQLKSEPDQFNKPNFPKTPNNPGNPNNLRNPNEVKYIHLTWKMSQKSMDPNPVLRCKINKPRNWWQEQSQESGWKHGLWWNHIEYFYWKVTER